MKALVTRPHEDAASLAAALAARGIEPLVEPMLTIRHAPDAADRLAPLLPGVQALLFTSANGVRAFAAAVARRDLPVLAVGDATAAAACAAGFAAVESAGGDVADLARLATARLRPAAGPLLHAAASAVAGDLAGRLGEGGFTVRRAALYTAEPATALAPATAEALLRGQVAAAFFFSPRTALSFVNLAAGGLAEPCRGVAAVALSPAVAAALRPIGWRMIRIADAPREMAVLAALDALLADDAAGKLREAREGSA